MLKKRCYLTQRQKKEYLNQIRELLIAQPEISFAYVHGSFIEQDAFGDVDLALYLDPLPEGIGIYYEFALENAIEELIHLPADLRLLNNAPLSFKYSVLRNGIRLFEKDDDLRSSFQERTLSRYYDFAPLRERYLKEALTP